MRSVSVRAQGRSHYLFSRQKFIFNTILCLTIIFSMSLTILYKNIFSVYSFSDAFGEKLIIKISVLYARTCRIGNLFTIIVNLIILLIAIVSRRWRKLQSV